MSMTPRIIVWGFIGWIVLARSLTAEAPQAKAPVSFDRQLRQTTGKERQQLAFEFLQKDIDGDGWLTEQELAGSENAAPLYGLFRELDKDGSGEISVEEYRAKFPMFEGDVRSFDRNENGTLDIEEFVHTPRLPILTVARFRRLDSTGDNVLSLQEFLRPVSPSFEPTSRLYFFHWDTDDDDKLTQQEYLHRGKDYSPTLLDKYRSRDFDDDGKVSRDEYCRPHLNGQWEQAAKRQARDGDADGDGFLSIQEFSTTPSGHFPDPLLFAILDQNQDEAIGLDEFLQFRARSQWAGFSGAFFKHDANHDNQLQRSEFLQESIAKPMPDISSLLDRIPAPIGFHMLDVDGSGGLALEELHVQQAPKADDIPATIRWRERRAAAKWLLETLDTNGDGQIDANEMQLQPLACLAVRYGKTDQLNATVAIKYQARDLDDDGKLTVQEFRRPFQNGKWESKIRQESTACDVDRDGILSLIEFAFTSQGRFPDPDLFPILDHNKNKQLDLEEFLSAVPKRQWPGFAASFFKHDVDANGTLSANEFLQETLSSPASDLSAHLDRIPAAVGFALLDPNENASIDLKELHVQLPPAADDIPATIRWRERRLLAESLLKELDRNGDDELDRAEMGNRWREVLAVRFGTNEQLPATATTRYRARDLDGDGRLSIAEYQQPFLGSKWEEKVQQEASSCDIDQDGQLSLLEFAFTPQGKFPSPELFPQLDTDGDQQIGVDEYVRLHSQRKLREQLNTFFANDSDNDGKLARAEFDAFSFDKLAKPLVAVTSHLPASLVFELLDTNSDGVIRLDEFSHGKRPNPSNASAFVTWMERNGAAKEFFEQLDQDADGMLRSGESMPELTSLLTIVLAGAKDTSCSNLVKFRARDYNSDGKMSRDEYVRSNLGTKWEQAARRQAIDFDADGDGMLSRIEFSLTPQGVFPSEELFSEFDADKDGSIDIVEWLRPMPENQWDRNSTAFYLADGDRDQGLSPKEFMNADIPRGTKVRSSLVRIAAVDQLRLRDRNADGSISFDEVFRLPAPDPEDRQRVLDYEYHELRARESFIAADTDEDQRLSTRELARYLDYAKSEDGLARPTLSPEPLPPPENKADLWDQIWYAILMCETVLAMALAGYFGRRLFQRPPAPPSHSQPHSGFNRLDALVVLLVFTLLTTLLMPAFSWLREDSRRISCTANLRHIGTALQSYHAAHQVLPPAAVWKPGLLESTALHAARRFDLTTYDNWATCLMPYLQDDHSALVTGPLTQSIGHDSNRTLRESTFSAYVCPSDSLSIPTNPFVFTEGGTSKVFARGNYGINGGTHNPRRNEPSTTTPLGDRQQLVMDDTTLTYRALGNGIAGINWSLSNDDFTNGLSTLVAVEELRAGLDIGDLRGVWALGQIGSSITWAHGVPGDATGPNNRTDRADDIIGCARLHDRLGKEFILESGMPCVWYIDSNYQATSRSQHSQGVNLLFVDGSVRFAHDDIDPGIWHVLHSRETPPGILDSPMEELLGPRVIPPDKPTNPLPLAEVKANSRSVLTNSIGMELR